MGGLVYRPNRCKINYLAEEASDAGVALLIAAESAAVVAASLEAAAVSVAEAAGSFEEQAARVANAATAAKVTILFILKSFVCVCVELFQLHL